MSIITSPASPPRAAPTKQQIIAGAQGKVSRDINYLFAQMLRVYKSNFDVVWNNTDKYTAQEFLAQAGPVGGVNAAELLRLSALLAATIESAQPTLSAAYKAPPKTFTANKDGTVTIGK